MTEVAERRSGDLFFWAGCRLKCNHVKGLAKLRRQLAVGPRAVREHKVQQTAFLTRGLFLEEFYGQAGKLQQGDAFLHVGLVGLLVLLDGSKDLALLLPPFGRLLLEEPGTNLAVQLVYVHGVNPLLELVVFISEPGYGLFPEPLLIDVAFP